MDFTFLDGIQIFGRDAFFTGRLQIISKYGRKAAMTDFTILLSCIGGVGFGSTIRKDPSAGRVGEWLTNGYHDYNSKSIEPFGRGYVLYPFNRINLGARPATSYSSIKPFSFNAVRNASGLLEVEYGEYPQTIASNTVSSELEKAYNNNTLKTTGKIYTTHKFKSKDRVPSFYSNTHTEYEYNGGKYIRFVGNELCKNDILSDGRKIKVGNPYWVKVEPITWLIDEIADVALSKKIIFSGVPFNNNFDYDGNFEKTYIKKFMDTYFSKAIIPSVIKEISHNDIIISNDRIEKFDSYKKPSEVLDSHVMDKINGRTNQAIENLRNLTEEYKEINRKTR